jgi:uncharacterized protein (TIGR00255 family)
MTGYGKAEGPVGNRKFTIELKALNSKQLDLNVRMPSQYKEKEMELRNWLQKQLVRGKVDVGVYYEADASEKRMTLNTTLMKAFYEDLKSVADEIGQENADYMSMLMRIPDVMKPEREELDESEWTQVMELVAKATDMLNDYRDQEGAGLETEFEGRINHILELENGLDEAINERVERVKSRINTNLEEFIDPEKVDRNRFEQEIIYYIEKFDVSEERQRLTANCTYFLDILKNGKAQGKKLGFISQEIGREINTLGSKANDATIQRSVVQMKDELEKIKEQVLNVL